MKLGWIHFVVVASLFASIARAQSSDTALDQPPAPEHGTIVGTTYANESLGFSFPIPDGWQINRDTVGAEREGEAERTPGGGLELLVIDQHLARPFRNRIVVTALDATLTSLTTKENVSKIVGVQVARDGRKLVSDATEVEIAGKQFYRSDYAQPVPGGTLAEAFVCTKFRQYYLGWTFVAGSPEELEGIINSLQRLSFRDESKPAVGIISSRPPTSSQLPQRVRVSQGVSTGLLVTRVQPHYPDEAKEARIQGLVVLRTEIDKNGDVEDLFVVSGDPLLVPAALEAVKQWKYKPFLHSGQPVSVETQVTVNFVLSER
jgi:TonB family protein